MPVDSSTRVQGRFFICGEEVTDMQLFVYELFPFESNLRPTQEWAECHFQEYDTSDLREIFSLPDEGNFQVLFTANLSGEFDSFSGEWDEDFDVIESKHILIPTGWFERFGFPVEDSQDQ